MENIDSSIIKYLEILYKVNDKEKVRFIESLKKTSNEDKKKFLKILYDAFKSYESKIKDWFYKIQKINNEILEYKEWIDVDEILNQIN